MDISLVIPTFRRNEALLGCLDSCVRQSAENFSFEVIVVSSGPDALLRRWVEPYQLQFPNVQFIEAECEGVNRARNLGASRAKGKFIYFIDDDCVLPTADHLKKILQCHSEHPHCVAIGGLYSSPAKSKFWSRYYNLMCNTWLEVYSENRGTMRLLGGNCSFRRIVFDSGIRFREEIQYGGAETELQLRLLQNGMRLALLPELTVHHNLDCGCFGIAYRAWRQSVERARRAPVTIEREYLRRLSRLRALFPRRILQLVPLLPYFMVGQAAYLTTRARSFSRKHA